MSTAAAVQAAASIAATLLRGISALFHYKSEDPYRYYRLGSLCERYYWGQLAGIPKKDRDQKWILGFAFFGTTSPPSGDAGAWATARKKVAKVSKLAPLMLEHKATKNSSEHWKMIRFDKPPPSKQQFWGWFDLGRAEYRDRFVPFARQQLGADPATFLEGMNAIDRKHTALIMCLRAGSISSTLANQLRQITTERAKIKKVWGQALPELKRHWRTTQAARMLDSPAAAQAELGRWVKERELAIEQAQGKAEWFGPPVPWAMNFAAAQYGRLGAAAVIRYLSPKLPDKFRAAMVDVLKLVAPAALQDPIVKGYLT